MTKTINNGHKRRNNTHTDLHNDFLFINQVANLAAKIPDFDNFMPKSQIGARPSITPSWRCNSRKE